MRRKSGRIASASGGLMASTRTTTRQSMTVQAMTRARVQSSASSGRSRLIVLMPRVVAVREAKPPAKPVSAIPREAPNHLTATYPANPSPETITTISQIERGLKAPSGPKSLSGTSGRTAPVTARNCSAMRASSGVKFFETA